jgi:hypothetical protein
LVDRSSPCVTTHITDGHPLLVDDRASSRSASHEASICVYIYVVCRTGELRRNYRAPKHTSFRKTILVYIPLRSTILGQKQLQKCADRADKWNNSELILITFTCLFVSFSESTSTSFRPPVVVSKAPKGRDTFHSTPPPTENEEAGADPTRLTAVNLQGRLYEIRQRKCRLISTLDAKKLGHKLSGNFKQFCSDRQFSALRFCSISQDPAFSK